MENYSVKTTMRELNPQELNHIFGGCGGCFEKWLELVLNGSNMSKSEFDKIRPCRPKGRQGR